ncbi:ubiquitin carboxyl-terminal hydrolase 34 [Physcia stellaris]|nr:ubiquitin carboxyl-terminal hydrolase 34 [Physcia stellaris]
MLVSQCQAIHARSLIPCQDTPDVKSTFDFNFRSPLPVLASGLFTGAKDYQPGPDGKAGTLLYTFRQEVPIPSYLFAVASGDIATAAVGPRSVVATGADELEACQWEVEADTERFIQTAEKIVCPYSWTTYNILVLPPSFPYGGMENPQYTFATPTFITGDRQNVDMIAHELAHSWSGNLVTNASWEHFWLNEGWTMYIQRRLEAAIHGEQYRDFSAIIGWKALSDSIREFGEDHEFTKLVIDLKGQDPDDAFSTVPYEKGFTFLYHLEKQIGKEKWDKFIPHYFTTFARKSLDSHEFKSTLLSFFSNDSKAYAFLKNLDWDKWFFAPGFPPKPDFDTSLADSCYALASQWENLNDNPGADFQPSSSDIAGWGSNQVVVFLEAVQEFQKPLGKQEVHAMGKQYGLLKSGNAELTSRFFAIGLKAKAEEVYGPTVELLGKVGRMKFVRPLYRQLAEVDRDLAVKTFEGNRDFYHPICRNLLEKDLFVRPQVLDVQDGGVTISAYAQLLLKKKPSPLQRTGFHDAEPKKKR